MLYLVYYYFISLRSYDFDDFFFSDLIFLFQIVNTSERLKVKSIRTSNMPLVPKVAPQSSSQSSNSLNRGAPKTPQGGNFHVLNRERNSSIGNKIGGPTLNSRTVVNPVNTAAPNSTLYNNSKFKSEMTQSSVMERKNSSQDRIKFFNTIRNGSHSNNSSFASAEHRSVMPSFASEKSSDDTSTMSKQSFVLDSNTSASMKNGNDMNHNSISLSELANVKKDEDESGSCQDYPNGEEKKFMKLLGWQEEGEEEPLTAKEIEEFIVEVPIIKIFG